MRKESEFHGPLTQDRRNKDKAFGKFLHSYKKQKDGPGRRYGQLWMATGKGVNLAAKVFCGNSYLRARGVLAGARRASANTPLARGAGNLGVVNGFVEGSVWR